jgi:hypothetical protein
VADDEVREISEEDMMMWKKEDGLGLWVRQFDEEADAQWIKMGMAAIWEANEEMERGVSERDNLSTFLAWMAKRMESARPHNDSNKMKNSQRTRRGIGDFAHPPLHRHRTNL